jgi:hypothetical protein
LSNYIITNGEIYHWGIKGMKWGRRRYQNPDGTLTPEGKTRYDDREKKKSMRKDVKNRRLLSDADIKKKIERIKLEKELKSLTEDELLPGKKVVSNILSNSGQKVATTLLTGAVLYATKAAMEKKFDIKEMAGYMTPKPKNK